MCGIAGIIGRLRPSHRTALDLMNAALAHRGPDGAGVWSSPPDDDGVGCLLGHRRLAIIDLSHAADQPMVDTAGGATRALVFNEHQTEADPIEGGRRLIWPLAGGERCPSRR